MLTRTKGPYNLDLMTTKRLLWPTLIIFYIIFLSINLLGLPLYLDEGIYIYWSYLISLDPSYAYVSMQDGKTPLFMWLTAFLNQPLNNLLLTGRFISVFASTVTLICFLIIGSKILGQKYVLIVFILFIISPLNALMSRLAFVDSLLSAFGSLSLLTLFFIRGTSAKKQIFRSLGFAVLTGIFLGLAFMTKTTARIFLISQLILFAFIIFEDLKNRKLKEAAIVTISALVVTGVYFEIVSYLRIGAYRFWGMISEKESDLVFTIPEIFSNFFITHTLYPYLKNLPNLLEYFAVYFNSLILLFLLGSVWIIKNKKHRWILFLTFFLTAGIFLSAKLIASRYFVIIIPGFLTIASIGFIWIWQKKSRNLKIIAVLLLLLPAYFTLKIIFQPINAYYPHNDMANFADYNLNALGLNESIDFLLPDKENSAIGVTGIWGVVEGSSLAFTEKGFEVHRLDNLIKSAESDDGVCEKGFVYEKERCWKIEFGDLISSSKKNKFIYLNTEKIDIETFKELANIAVVKEFTRPRTGLKVYLIQLFPDN